MEKKNYQANEKIRKSVLESYNLPNSCSDPDYDELTFLTAAICQVPVAYLSIIEPTNICFKARYGISLSGINRELSFTQDLLNSGKDLIVLNYKDTPELFDNKEAIYNQKFKFFAGVLLKDSRGYPLGALNILDTVERELNATQKKGLKTLAHQSFKLMEFSKQNNEFQLIQNKLKQKYEELEKFASLVSHDIKSPLANIISLTELLKEENQGKFDEETTQYLNYLVESSYSLRNYVDGILSFYRSEHILEKDYENVDLHQILQQIAKLYEVSDDVILEYPKEAMLHHVNKAALTQVFLNLISNGLKYNKKSIRKIQIKFEEQPFFYHFEVKDNGEGFPEENSSKIFELFTTLDTTDREGNPGSGIGLATVNKLVQSMGGEIKVRSTPGEGSSFSFTIQRL
ncbi:HAMP domain-containing histidine kinase [Antarcticibacterium arcticum]|uniref:histidine kinase n=1 Tax=Antarcticibacterium arcticum TaxID=2585771 RepID=A0A5B8YLG5_9FLAO|nr:HAMP domain-containing sensor histidine kinase [Antarcticibacterium arcticum]QED37106.1 HAMP domain-containing histidine kinase [Antarcticibacterium arcticum]